MEKGDIIKVNEILDGGKTAPNIININWIKRIQFEPDKNQAWLYFSLQANMVRDYNTTKEGGSVNREVEDMICIRVPDINKFLEKFKHLMLDEVK